MTNVLLCTIDDFEDGSARGFNEDGRAGDCFFVIRKGERFFAYKNSCPHIDGSGLNWKKDAYLSPDRAHIRCSSHGALFDLETGEGVKGACIGLQLTPINIEIEDNYLKLT